MNYEKYTFEALCKLFPDVSPAKHLETIDRYKDKLRHDACMQRHEGLTMDNWNYNANYPGGIK